MKAMADVLSSHGREHARQGITETDGYSNTTCGPYWENDRAVVEAMKQSEEGESTGYAKHLLHVD